MTTAEKIHHNIRTGWAPSIRLDVRYDNSGLDESEDFVPYVVEYSPPTNYSNLNRPRQKRFASFAKAEEFVHKTVLHEIKTELTKKANSGNEAKKKLSSLKE